MNYSKADILSRCTLFANISDRSRQALADICISKHLEKRQILFHEGDKGHALYLLVTGSIQLFKAAADRDVVIRVLQPGEFFAEVILFERDRYPVSAIALKPSHVYLIPKHQFGCLLEDAVFRKDFIANLLAKMRFLADQIQYLSSHDVEDRLRFFLESHFGRKEKLIPAMSKKDMAAAIGATPETLSRLLLRLKNADLLFWEGKEMVIRPGFWGDQ